MNKISKDDVKQALEVVLENLTKEEEIPETKLNDEKENNFSLENLLINTLRNIEIPVSVSFINLFLNQRKVDQITERFLSSEEIQDKFSLFLVGCDLKIKLKEHKDKDATNLCTYARDLLEIIHKDTTKLRDLRVKFTKNKLSEVLYADFLTNYNSNKYKMKLPFIVRNSHSLAIYKKEDNTYVRFINENEQVVRMCDISKGFEVLLLKCCKELLSHFTVPLDQGILQTCFNLGMVIDKKFLNKYHHVFVGHGSVGVKLRHKTSEDTKRVVENIETDINMEEIEVALDEKRSIVIVGSTMDTPIFYYGESTCSDKVAALVKLNELIGCEIEKINKY